MAESDAGRRASPAIVFLAVVVAALLGWIAWQQGWLHSTDRLFVETPDAAGMTVGMPVTTRGVVIGRVERIGLTAADAGRPGARLELGIDRGFIGQIAKGTQARLVREYLIGKPAIDLVPPAGGAQPVAPGDLLAFEDRSKDGQQLLQEVQAALMPVIADARKLTESLNDPDGTFQQTLKAGQEMAAKMPEIADKAGEVIDKTQQAVRSIESGAVSTFQKANQAVGVVAQAAPEVIEKVQQAAATSQKASAEMQAMAAQASERLPGVLDQVQAIAVQANEMVSGARQTWPISMLTGTPTTPQSLPIDSIGGLPLPGEKP